ncbi:MAG: hypothetical protein ABIE94_05420 [archaeon]
MRSINRVIIPATVLTAILAAGYIARNPRTEAPGPVPASVSSIFSNLTDYHDPDLSQIVVDGTSYMTLAEYEPSVIVGLSFGADYGEGSVNASLAQSVLDAQEYFGQDLQAIVQSEIGTCMSRLGEDDYVHVGENYAEGEGAAMRSKESTGTILEYSREHMESLNLDTGSILYVAHPAHMQRVIALGRSLGLEGQPFLGDIGWSEDDPQLWVRNGALWLPREVVVRTYDVITGNEVPIEN